MLLLKSLLLFLFVTLTGFVALPLSLLLFSQGFLTVEIGSYRFFGLFPIVLGAVIALWTTLSLALVGKGTPAPFDPSKRLVTEGLFKYVRNPMYLGAVIVMVGEAVLTQSLVVLLLAVVMWMFFHVFVVYYEEPDLGKRFGQAYEEYIRTVPRWFPRIPKKRASF
jgi:protein-S-isoprenylcysteine O-methyltransferase Ste14